MDQYIEIYSYRVCNELLKCGYHIAMVAENPKVKGKTIFYFWKQPGLANDIKKILK